MAVYPQSRHQFTGDLGQYPLGIMVRNLPNSYADDTNDVIVVSEHLGICTRNTNEQIQAYSLAIKTEDGKLRHIGQVYHDMIVPVDITEQFSKAKP